MRQAKRFAFHVLTLPAEQKNELADLITSLTQSVVECVSCHRFFTLGRQNHPFCSLCQDTNRDRQKLLVVATDNDVTVIEKSGVYDGLYFVLGGMVSLLVGKETEQKIRAGALKGLVAERTGKESLEVILGFAVNPDGENTSRFVESLLKESIAARQVKISYLGRGLSTGSELEYADAETIKNALRNRV